MPSCSSIKRKQRKVCIGDLDTEITIQSRSIASPDSNGVDFDETFTGKATVWALVNTVSGKTMFDGSGVERDVTHEIYIRYVSGVTSEDWILLNGKRLDILPVEDLDERNEFMKLNCSFKGTSANKINGMS